MMYTVNVRCVGPPMTKELLTGRRSRPALGRRPEYGGPRGQYAERNHRGAETPQRTERIVL
jgi:hypothetical protein